MVDSEAEAEVGDDEQAGTAGSGSDMVERETGGREGGRQKENKNGEQEWRNKGEKNRRLKRNSSGRIW